MKQEQGIEQQNVQQKQSGEVVISISQRRNVITIFKGNSRYVLEDTSKVSAKKQIKHFKQ